jgi:peptidoglycan/LPS O-acetylase OafA/YrhL
MTQEGGTKIPHIDGLRAIAVIFVVWYHLSPATLPGGFSGVDVFLVISGCVVSSALARHGNSPGWAWRFFARRAWRILPPLVVCLLATVVASSLLIPDAWLSDRNSQTGRMAFFGASNLLMLSRGDDYFSPVSDFNPFAHTWSLGLEEQFYLLFPLLFMGWLRGGAWRYGSWVICVAALAGSFGYAAWLSPRDFRAAFYLLPTRAWEFLAGVLVFQWSTSAWVSRIPTGVRDVTAGTGIALLISASALAVPAMFPFPGALVPVVGTSLVLLVLTNANGSYCARLLGCEPLTAVGRMSYSLYLWHWPIFVIFRWTVGLDEVYLRVSAVTLALGTSLLSWRYVENVLRNRMTEARATVALMSAMVLVTLAWAAFHQIDKMKRHWSVSTVMRYRDDWYPSTRDGSAAPCGAFRHKREVVGEGHVTTLSIDGCGSSATAPKVTAIGDSHALAFVSMFTNYVVRTGAPVSIYDNGGCGALTLQPGRESSAHCRSSFEAAMARMTGDLREGDVVFLPSLRMSRTVDQWGVLEPVARTPAGMIEARRTISQLRATGARVVLLAPNLLLNVPLFRCADPWTSSQQICSRGDTVDRGEFETRRKPMLDALQAIASADDGVSVFDPFPILCPTGPTCYGFRDRRPLFFDGDHLSGYGNRILLPSFIEAMKEASTDGGVVNP